MFAWYLWKLHIRCSAIPVSRSVDSTSLPVARGGGRGELLRLADAAAAHSHDLDHEIFTARRFERYDAKLGPDHTILTMFHLGTAALVRPRFNTTPAGGCGSPLLFWHHCYAEWPLNELTSVGSISCAENVPFNFNLFVRDGSGTIRYICGLNGM